MSSCDSHCSPRCASSSFHMLVNPLPVAPIISFNCSFLSRADLVHQVLWESQETFTSLKFSSWSGCLLQAISIRKLSGSPGKCKEIRSVLPMSTVLLSVLAMSTVFLSLCLQYHCSLSLFPYPSLNMSQWSSLTFSCNANSQCLGNNQFGSKTFQRIFSGYEWCSAAI